jgi:menaquinone-specific isochorismate synthase
MTTVATLRAVTREVEAGRDVVDGFEPDGFAWLHNGTRIVASGAVARVAPADVVDALAAIDTDDPLGLAGTGALAVGALPFAPHAPAELVIPAWVRGDAHGKAWITEIGAAPGVAPTLPGPPTRFTVGAAQTRAGWRASVDAALAAIERGELEKVVLAREVFVEADVPFDRPALLRRLVAQQPGCFVYASDGLMGASPELLVRRRGTTVESRPMAGTAVAGGSDAPLRALAESVKEGHEHRLVVDAIADALGALCDELEVAPTPDVAVFGAVAHLATPIRGRLVTPAPSALELARVLHPTPAVGGTPRAAALEAIAGLEGFDRGRYAGPVGWVDARGDGEWAIALRGAELDGNRARLVAGAGIVAGSDPAAEWAETEAKLEPMLRALVRP